MIADVLHDGVPVVIASQCQQAEVLLGHYETGDAIAAPVRSDRAT